MIILFASDNSVVMGVNSHTGQNAWVCLLVATIISIPVFVMYARIIWLIDGKDFFTAILDWLREIPDRIVTALPVWYYLYLAAIVSRNFSEFMEIVVIPETSQIPMMISFLLAGVHLCKSRIQVTSQWPIVSLRLTIDIMIITAPSTITNMRPQNLLSVLERSPPEIMRSSYQIFVFPYAECVVPLLLIDAVKHGNLYKIFPKGLSYSTSVLLVIALRNVLTFDPQLMEKECLPSYTCARIMEIGSFLSRIRGTISVNFTVAELTKTSLCPHSRASGLTKPLNIPGKLDPIIIPIFMFVLVLCVLSCTDAVQMFDFLDLCPLYALPLQVIVPLVTWLVGEWRTHNKKTSLVQTTLQTP